MMSDTFPALRHRVSSGLVVSKGACVAALIACAASFLSEHYGVPAMLMALLLGIAFHFLYEDNDCAPGINFASRAILRIGVALLGLRVSWQMLAELGAGSVLWIVLAVLTTIGLGLIGSRFLKQGWHMGVLTGGSVAICGASAAMAISAVLPRNERSERDLTFTVMAVTILSTIAMVVYPIIAESVGMSPPQAGLFLGATIHDVAQVVGAGYTVSDETGDVATAVKLLRVALLAPVIFFLGLAISFSGRAVSADMKKPPLLPLFVVVFLVLMSLNTVLSIPGWVNSFAGHASKWMLLTAVAGAGMKTSLRQLSRIGGQAIILVVAETLYLGFGFLLVVGWT